MPFNLEVEFTGLCLYVKRRDESVTVLMPDCRRTIANAMHADDTRGDPHVGYMRVNLANINTDSFGISPGGNHLDGPQFEMLYQFDRDELNFGVNGTPAVASGQLGLPDFGVILGGRRPIPTMYAGNPEPLLFRTTLKGGQLVGRRGGGNWEFKGVSVGGKPYQGQFSEVLTWKREGLPGNRLTLTLRDFNQNDKQTITLVAQPDDRSAEPVIRLKIANLCSTNPLEWDRLDLHRVTTSDKDFKWLYRLYGSDINVLPIPEQTSDLQAFGTDDCTGGVGDE